MLLPARQNRFSYYHLIIAAKTLYKMRFIQKLCGCAEMVFPSANLTNNEFFRSATCSDQELLNILLCIGGCFQARNTHIQ